MHATSPFTTSVLPRVQVGQRKSKKTTAHLLYLPPSVAESRKWVPYFLIMLSVMAPRLGLLPSCLMVWRNSGSSGKEKPLFSCLSRAKLFTFQRPNSLQCHKKKRTLSGSKGHTTHECYMQGHLRERVQQTPHII